MNKYIAVLMAVITLTFSSLAIAGGGDPLFEIEGKVNEINEKIQAIMAQDAEQNVEIEVLRANLDSAANVAKVKAKAVKPDSGVEAKTININNYYRVRGYDDDDGCITAYGNSICCRNRYVVCDLKDSYSGSSSRSGSYYTRSILNDNELDCNLLDLFLSGGVGYAVFSQLGGGSGKTAFGTWGGLLAAKLYCGL